MGAHRRLACLVLGTLLAAGGASAADPTTVLIVRHAEKESSATDPPLSAVGKARARVLAHVAGSAGVRAVFHTQYRRTLETVEPLAAQLNLSPIQHAAADTPGLVSTIRTSWSGKTILVAGHSNTVPEIVKALTGVAMEDIPDAQFDNLYVVVLPAGGPAGLTHLKYGARTP